MGRGLEGTPVPDVGDPDPPVKGLGGPRDVHGLSCPWEVGGVTFRCTTTGSPGSPSDSTSVPLTSAPTAGLGSRPVALPVVPVPDPVVHEEIFTSRSTPHPPCPLGVSQVDGLSSTVESPCAPARCPVSFSPLFPKIVVYSFVGPHLPAELGGVSRFGIGRRGHLHWSEPLSQKRLLGQSRSRKAHPG